MNYDLKDKVVIITGAARGVGRTMVATFVDQGARVLAADRDEQGLAETCAPYPDVFALVEDVSSPAGAEKIVAAAVEHFGRLDICVNNAAVAPHTALVEETMEVWDRVYAVNCRGTFLMTQAAGKAMIAGGRGGRIINFSSGASLRGGPGAAAY
ncbi:MAG TPA: SDR family oxidoreductase, partial [Anaerolineaceae bacterium]|nr:SDR family oxidoreductase [Anaerolineaceae bacterium]